MELEYKFMLDSAAQGMQVVQALRAGTIEDARLISEKSVDMDSTYFDTAQGTLWRKGFALRLRKENGRLICCLKCGGPADISGLSRRGEWESACEGIDDGLEKLKALGAPDCFSEICAGALRVAAVVRFLRCAYLLETGTAVCELSLDQGNFGTETGKNRFCELELEWKSGEKEDFCAFAGFLARHYALKPEERSKLVRALAVGGCAD